MILQSHIIVRAHHYLVLLFVLLLFFVDLVAVSDLLDELVGVSDTKQA